VRAVCASSVASSAGCQPALANWGWARCPGGCPLRTGLLDRRCATAIGEQRILLPHKRWSWSWSWRRGGPLGPLSPVCSNKGTEGAVRLGRSQRSLHRPGRTDASQRHGGGIWMPFEGEELLDADRALAEVVALLHNGSQQQSLSDRWVTGSSAFCSTARRCCSWPWRDSMPLFRSC